MKKKYADLHLHPSTKAFLTEENALDKKDCWHTFDIIPIANELDSQSNLDQITKGNVHLSIAAIIPGERAFFKSPRINFFGAILADASDNFILKIARNKISYLQLLNAEIQHLKKSVDEIDLERNGRDTVQIINHVGEATEDDKSYLILAIEGGHATSLNSDDGDVNHLEGLEKMFKSHHRFLYLTLAHLADQGKNYLSNHTFGTYFLKNKGFRPQRIGISVDGFNAIDLCYKNNPTVLIDIKHMSLLARKQFYVYRKKQNYKHPLIASHVAVTGRSWDDFLTTQIGSPFFRGKNKEWIVVTHKRPRGIGKGNKWHEQTYFNPWSINLFDEDILEIYQSKGIIGLILDRGILGCVKKRDLRKINEYEQLVIDGKVEAIREENKFTRGYLKRTQEFFNSKEYFNLTF
ncbi:MAG: hypothetical protein AAFO07_22580, partial [Bacteroidota bacterium]